MNYASEESPALHWSMQVGLKQPIENVGFCREESRHTKTNERQYWNGSAALDGTLGLEWPRIPRVHPSLGTCVWSQGMRRKKWDWGCVNMMIFEDGEEKRHIVPAREAKKGTELKYRPFFPQQNPGRSPVSRSMWQYGHWWILFPFCCPHVSVGDLIGPIDQVDIAVFKRGLGCDRDDIWSEIGQ